MASNYNPLIFILLFSQFAFIGANCQLNQSGIIVRRTQFYSKQGDTTFTHDLKILYKDSMAIQVITGINRIIDSANKSTLTYPLLFCRFIDLKNKAFYDYKHFSDTATFYNKSILPDSLFTDAGWSFYSQKAFKSKGIPEELNDTSIKNIPYKRVKFLFTWNNPEKEYLIGYFACKKTNNLFSLERNYSQKINCPLVKYYHYKTAENKPFASTELLQVADSLSQDESKIFDAWERSAKNNPVVKK